MLRRCVPGLVVPAVLGTKGCAVHAIIHRNDERRVSDALRHRRNINDVEIAARYFVINATLPRVCQNSLRNNRLN